MGSKDNKFVGFTFEEGPEIAGAVDTGFEAEPRCAHA
jgi:hypothetical protein